MLSRATLRLAAPARSARALRNYSATVHDEFDAVIVGGGPAGLALANALGEDQPGAAVRQRC
jgi:ribulose 1,5-bisphosphate synthetase/thiazole synthase